MVAIDFASLVVEGPISIQLLCPDPQLMEGLYLSTIYFGKAGRRLYVDLDLDAMEVGDVAAPPPLHRSYPSAPRERVAVRG